jgi:putative tricarboxylic transport membrane protein
MGDGASDGVVSRKAAEVGFALVLLGFGAAIAWGALELDTGWGGSGPEAGYFPFRIGVLIIAAAGGVLILELLRSGGGMLMGGKGLRNVALFALPLIGLIVAVPHLGIYLAGAAYLLVAVGLVGGAGWRLAAVVAVLAPALLFVLFEFVFRTPLPKGPLGPLLGMI